MGKHEQTESSDQMSPAELMAMILEMTVGRIAIADDDATDVFCEQFVRHRSGSGNPCGKERAERPTTVHNHALQAAFQLLDPFPLGCNDSVLLLNPSAQRLNARPHSRSLLIQQFHRDFRHPRHARVVANLPVFQRQVFEL